jgi:response regulator NasT
VSAYSDRDLIERAEADHILAYLVKPIKQADLQPAIAIAMRRFEQFQKVEAEAPNLQQAMDDRRTVERAKTFLMRRGGVDEPSAFERLQKVACRKGRRLIEIAEAIVITEEAMDGQ